MYHLRCSLHIHEGPCLRLVARRRRARAPTPCAAAAAATTATATLCDRSSWTVLQVMATAATAATTAPTMTAQVVLG